MMLALLHSCSWMLKDEKRYSAFFKDVKKEVFSIVQ